jgi:hypothetical protein
VNLVNIRSTILVVAFALSFILPSISSYAQGWQNAQLLNLSSEPACKMARIYASKNGGFHAVYLNASPWRVQYRRYVNGYLGQVKILDENFVANPDICEAGNGDVHVVWEDWEGANYPGYAVSTDGGNNFTVGKVTTWGGCKIPVVAPLGPSNGPNALMSFTRMVEGQDKRVFYSIFNGSTWSTAVEIPGAWTESVYQIDGICRSLYDGTVYRLYGGTNATTLYLQRFNGVYWEPPMLVYSGEFFARPCVAANAAGQVMVVWEVNQRLRCRLYTPGSGWSAEMLQEDLSNFAAITAIPGTNDFYLVYTHDMKRIYGRRFSGGGWLPKELVSNGLPDAFTVGADVTADPNGSGTLYACWEYWGSGNCQQYFSVRPGGTPPDSRIAGTVRDQFGQGISGVTVGTGPYATVSGSGGAYSLAVPAGTYSVSANKAYYTGQTIPNVVARSGQTTYLDFTITANPPGPVTMFKVQPSNGLNRLSWTNPTSGNFQGTLIRFKTTGYPTGPDDGTLLCDRAALPGSSDSFEHTGLTNGVTYYYAAFAHDDASHYSIGVNGQGTPHFLTVSEVRQFEDNYVVDLYDKVVTGVFSSDGCIYVSDPNGIGGIRVATNQSGLSVGDRVNINGRMSTRTLSGYPSERQISYASVTKISSGAAPRPVAMSCKNVGGAAIGSLVPGVKNGVGANNMGSLIRIVGKVTKVIGSYLFVDDGSKVENVSGSGPEIGVMVRCTTTPSVSVGNIVSVTGIAEGSIPAGWTTNRSYLRLRSANDLRLLYTAPTTGTISGTVKNTAGVGLVGAVVSTNVGGYSATTGTNGAYTLSNVAPGTYTVTASKSGYESQSIPNVSVSVGQTTNVNFTLNALPSEKLVNRDFEGGFIDFWGGRIANGWNAVYRNQSSADNSEWSDYNWGSPQNYTQQIYVSLAGIGESGIMQRVTGLTPGTNFTFSAYAYQSSTNSTCWIGADGNGGTSLPSRSTAFANIAGQWNYAEVTGTVGSSGAVSVFLWVWHQSNPPGTCWFNNASLMAR